MVGIPRRTAERNTGGTPRIISGGIPREIPGGISWKNSDELLYTFLKRYLKDFHEKSLFFAELLENLAGYSERKTECVSR